MANDDRLPLLRARPDEIAPVALVVGDPARAERAAEQLDESREVASNREYATFTGRLNGREITIASHGVGAAGAAVCFEELARAGVAAVVRVGTCGSLRDEIRDGDLVVATSAVRDEGLTPRLVPLGYPAAADLDLAFGLRAAAVATGGGVHSGVVLTTDLFYPSDVLPPDWRPWQAAGVLAVEMETAALFVTAALRGQRAAAILAVDGNPTRAAADMSGYDPYRDVVRGGVDRAIVAALASLSALSEAEA